MTFGAEPVYPHVRIIRMDKAVQMTAGIDKAVQMTPRDEAPDSTPQVSDTPVLIFLFLPVKLFTSALAQRLQVRRVHAHPDEDSRSGDHARGGAIMFASPNVPFSIPRLLQKYFPRLHRPTSYLPLSLSLLYLCTSCLCLQAGYFRCCEFPFVLADLIRFGSAEPVARRATIACVDKGVQCTSTSSDALNGARSEIARLEGLLADMFSRQTALYHKYLQDSNNRAQELAAARAQVANLEATLAAAQVMLGRSFFLPYFTCSDVSSSAGESFAV